MFIERLAKRAMQKRQMILEMITGQITKNQMRRYSLGDVAVWLARTILPTTALNYRATLGRMAQHFDIRLAVIPWHRKIPGNCRPDKHARLGTTFQVEAQFKGVGVLLATSELNNRLFS